MVAVSAAQKKTSGPSGRKPSAYVTFTQQLKPEFWPGWDVALILSGDVRAIGEEILRRYAVAGGDCQGFWIIKHDKDVLADGCPKDDHVHVVIQQSPGRKVEGKLQCTAMDQVFGFGDKSVVKGPLRGGRIENAWSYLIHAKDPDKHQYGVEEVVTLRGKDYAEIEAEHRDAWARRAVIGRKAAVPMKEWNELGDTLVQKVLDGEVDELDILRDKTLMDIYTRNEAKVNLALKNRAKREMLFEVEKLRAGVFQKTVIWAMGASDQGKSYLVESVAAELSARLGWPVFRATAKNGPDAYNGEPIFMMNEPSSRVMEWADFLQLLDPRQGGPISARYYNKPDAAPRLILIAVSVDPVEFGFFIPGKRSTGDSLDQVVRRITLMIEARKIDGEPHYSVSRVGEVEPYKRTIWLPGADRNGNVNRETVWLGYDKAETDAELTHAETLDVVLDAVAVRSPDTGLVTSAQRRLDDSTAALAARGVVFSAPPVPLAGGAT
ncbi:putative replication initiator protein [Luteococcus japonicus LSP_Lj1]|uniref:Putative replication initiator protein n=1 Tax=Luteococcus japonicus LSP_Lj1 TaxID=1255658 RepID=A0A1R4IJ82_9ACTN|nr:putative replication initiator protein [Luteococcus japonicus LSP_Lj1]